MDPTYCRPDHIYLLGDYLLKVERGEIKRLIVEMPPRHGKSETVTVKFPAWCLGRHPYWRVIIAGHTATLAARFSMRARNDLAAYGPEVFEVGVNPDVSAMYRWDVLVPEDKSGRPPGGMIAAGIGGPITGQGAHLAIIDDPIKDAEQAASKLQRDAMWDWYRFVLRTRLMPGGAVILVLTRWHEDDLAGRLIKQAKEDPEADQWTRLRLSAIAEDPKDVESAEKGEDLSDPLGREPGTALWPEQYNEHALASIKASVGSYVWNALYQQRPSPPEGNIFKRDWWQFYRQPPERFEELIQSWDCAFKDNDDSDYVVGQVWGRVKADKYLLDQVRGRMSFPATITAIKTLSAKWPRARAKLVEDKANGPAVIASLKHDIPGLIAVNPQGGKVVRAQAVSPDVEAGNVYLPDPSIAPWVHDFIEECTAFPTGANDDQVDAMTQALARWIVRRFTGPLDKPKGW